MKNIGMGCQFKKRPKVTLPYTLKDLEDMDRAEERAKKDKGYRVIRGFSSTKRIPINVSQQDLKDFADALYEQAAHLPALPPAPRTIRLELHLEENIAQALRAVAASGGWTVSGLVNELLRRLPEVKSK